MSVSEAQITAAFSLATERYAALGVDVEAALAILDSVSLSLHCWQGDDVRGFENTGPLDGGIAATGNHPGRARNGDELRQDLDQVYRLLPGHHRLNLHALYAEPSSPRPRNELRPEDFARWLDWAASAGRGIDFNPTCFAHPQAADGLTLSHPDAGIRRFWIEHCQACRRIGAHFGHHLGSTTVTNIWVPDGMKDLPADRLGPRQRLRAALDEVLAEPLPAAEHIDSCEAKLFGIGSESYVVGSHEFYLGYAVQRGDIHLCLDAGHFHPTEQVADKISTCLLDLKGLLLHVSRGVRWDSDHVVLLDDATQAIMQEVVRGGFLPRVRIGLDFFDASINRIAAWTIGARAALKALLGALLEPIEALRASEKTGDYGRRLALMEEAKTMPLGAVWDVWCLRQGVPPAADWLAEVDSYSATVLADRA